MGTRRTAVIVILLVSLATLAAACGSSGGPTSYTSTDYKFSLTYDSSVLTQSTSISAAGTAGGKSVFDVGFVDTKGTKVGGEYRDGVVVSVYKLNQTVTDAMLPLVKAELEKILPQLESALGSGSTLRALTEVDLNGVKGFSTSGSYSVDGTKFTAKLYFLINGNLEYEITTQAAEARWQQMQPAFKQIVDSFKATK
jgi:hypothetical protein